MEDAANEKIVTANTAKSILEFNLCVLNFRILKTFLSNGFLARIAKKVGNKFYVEIDF